MGWANVIVLAWGRKYSNTDWFDSPTHVRINTRRHREKLAIVHRGKYNNKVCNRLSHDVFTSVVDSDVSTAYCYSQCILHQAMRSTGCASQWSAVIGGFQSSSFRWKNWRLGLKWLPRRFADIPGTGLLLFFLIVGIHASGISIPLFLLTVIRVKSCVDSFLEPTGAPMWVLINNLYFVPKRVVAGLIDQGLCQTDHMGHLTSSS